MSFQPLYPCSCVCSILERGSSSPWHQRLHGIPWVQTLHCLYRPSNPGTDLFVLTALDWVSIIRLAFVSVISKLHKDYLFLNPCSLFCDTGGIYSILRRAHLPLELNYTQKLNSWPCCNEGKTWQPSRDFTQTPALSSERSALQDVLFPLASHSRTPQGHCEKTTFVSYIRFRGCSAQAMKAPQRLGSQIHGNQMRI